jgi:hypothetical protein
MLSLRAWAVLLRQIVRDPENGFTLMSIMDIMAAVRNKYGRMRITTKTDLAERMTTRLVSTEGFDTHLSILKELFIISKTGGHPVKESDQVDILRASVLGHSLIDQALKQYDFENSDESTYTFRDLATYILDGHRQHHGLRSLYHTSSRKQSPQGAASGKVNKQKRKDGKSGKDIGKKKPKGNRTNGEPVPEKVLKYCHAHGTQHTHTSQECKLMAADTNRFTTAMRIVKGPNTPLEGAKKSLDKTPNEDCGR